MLVLSRRERERICLGDSIVVTVVRVAGDKVRLGIEAPADMVVLRGELEVLPAPRLGAIIGATAPAAANLLAPSDSSSVPAVASDGGPQAASAGQFPTSAPGIAIPTLGVSIESIELCVGLPILGQ